MRNRTTWILTAIAYTILLVLGITYFLQERWDLLRFDVLIGMIGIGVFLWLFEKAHQDNWSYGGFLIVILLHSAFFYESSPLGVSWDHYMHFIGGAVIALIADRLYFEEHGRTKRAALLVLVALGVGAVHEIVEWLGYAYLGEGEGFLLFGAGDVGEWRNTVLDLVFDLLGGLATAAAVIRRRR